MGRSFQSIWKRTKRGSWRIAAMLSINASRKCSNSVENLLLLHRLWMTMEMKLDSLSFANMNLAHVSNFSPHFLIFVIPAIHIALRLYLTCKGFIVECLLILEKSLCFCLTILEWILCDDHYGLCGIIRKRGFIIESLL